MQSEGKIDFWFSIGSTYTYLTVCRLAEIEKASGITFEWRPFDVRTIMKEMDNIPFSTKPVKMNYMWRDVERRAQKYGVPIQVPAPYPLKQLGLANRVATVGRREGWCRDYVTATYRRWFVDGQESGSEPNLSESLTEVGQDADRVLKLAQSEDINAAYRADTAEARDLKVFGAPTFVVDGELFWGDDRLEDAIDWHRNSNRK